MNAVDTNVLGYLFDADQPVKRQRALELLARLSPTDTLVPWQVVCELGAVLTKIATKGTLAGTPLDGVAAVLARYRVVLPQVDLVPRALQLRAKYQMSYWDALIVTACADANVTTLYSEDIQSAPIIEGVKIINPFA